MEAKIHCKYDELADVKKLKNHPKNRNKHGQDQIERLAELYKYHGVRHPIIVSNLTGFIVAGHGRKLSAIRAGIKKFPIVYQDFESTDADIGDLGPDFDINMLGIHDFTLDVAEKESDQRESEESGSESSHKTCPHCGESLDD